MEDIDDQFSQYVSEAIDSIPSMYQEKMRSVAILVEDYPTPLQREKLQLRRGTGLFGLYEGVPLPKRGGAVYTTVPDTITIFKHPMMDLFTSPTSLKQQIQETLWHEVAHYFGLNHDQIDKAKKHDT